MLMSFIITSICSLSISANIKTMDGVAYEGKYHKIPAFKLEERYLYVGSTIKVKVSNAKEGMKWYWISQTKNIATITSEGVIKPKSVGKATFKGKCNYEGQDYVIEYNAFVKKPKL